MRKIDLESLKLEHIGKTYNWLFIENIIRDDNGNIKFVCKCKCGNKCVCSYYKVINNKTKSCGCYSKSKEKGHKHSEFLRNNHEIIQDSITKLKSWYKNNPDKLQIRSDNHRLWWEQNRDTADLSKPSTQKLRGSKLYTDLLPILHKDYHEKLLSGNIKRDDIILTLCPICHNYGKHKFHDMYLVNDDRLKYNHALRCDKCNMKHISHYEQEIADYISSFCDEIPIKNNRNVIKPYELDLYHQNKNIAIEFNGDYWHSNRFKSQDYHYNKFRKCLDNNIVLVSIFETHWLNNEYNIKNYLYDLFNNIENSISYYKDHINNNYPIPNIKSIVGEYITDYYNFDEHIVYTCGYTKIT